MKRSLSVLLLVAFLVLPLFAMDKGKSEIDVKVGANVSPNFTVSGNDLIGKALLHDEVELNSVNNGVGVDGKTGIVVGLEYFYYVMKDLGIGVGVNKAFPIALANDDVVKFDSTNIYTTAKQNINVEGFLDNIYFLGRIGYAINNAETKMEGKIEADNGLIWGLGVGVEKNNILLEVVYSVSYFKFGTDDMKLDITESGFGVQVGYKFEL